MESDQNTGRTVIIVMITQVITLGLPIITFPLLISTFDVTSYGIWVEAGTISSLFVAFSAYSMFGALGATIAQKNLDADQVYANTLYLFLAAGGLLTVVMALGAPVINRFTAQSAMGERIIQLLSVNVLTGSLNLLARQVYRLRLQALRGNVFDVVLGLGRLVAVILAIGHRDLERFAITFTLIQIVLASMQTVVAYWHIPLYRPSLTIMRKLIMDTANFIAINQTEWVIQYGDRLMLSIISTSAAVAIYAASYQLTVILSALAGPFLYVLLPALSQQWEAAGESAGQYVVRRYTRFMLIITIPAVLGLGLTGNSLLRLISDEFAQGDVLILMIAIGIGLNAIGISLQYVYQVRGQIQTLRNIFLVTAVFNVLANLVAIPLFDYYGAGVTTLLTFALTFYLLWRYLEMPFRALFDMSAIWRCVLACVPMGLWVWWLVDATVIGLGVAVVGGIILYGMSIVVLKVLSFSEIKELLHSLRLRKPLESSDN
jgi:O-antigen/teichoic acid export membrane protein